MHWLILFSGVALFAGAIAYHLVDQLWSIKGLERDRLLTQARVVRENLKRQLLGTDKALLGIRDDVARGRAVGSDLNSMDRDLRRLCAVLPGVRTLMVVDRKGTVLFSNRPARVGRDMAATEFFTQARDAGKADTLYLLPPHRNPLGEWGIHLVRVSAGPHGAFDGIVAATLDPQYFETLLGSVNYASDMWSALAHEDGLQLLMVPRRKGQPGRNLAVKGSFFSRYLASGLAEMVSSGVVASTGERRMMANTMIPKDSLPLDKTLVIGVARDLGAITDYWRQEAWAWSLTVVSVAVFSVLGLVAYQRRQRFYLDQEAEAQAGLEASEHRFRTVFECSFEAMLLLEGSRFIDCNAATLAMLGLTDREQLIGRSPLDISPEIQPDGQLSREKCPQQVAAAVSGGGHLFEWTHVRQNGETFPVEVLLTGIQLQGMAALHVVWRDITRRKEEEHLLKQSKEALEVMVRERTIDLTRTVAALKKARNVAEEANRTKTVFLANMSHELRTPINGIMGMVQLMQTTPLDAEQREYAENAVRSCRRLTRLLGDILDLSRIEADKLDLVEEPFDPWETLGSVEQLFEPAARQKGVRLRVVVDPALPHLVRGDATRVLQVFTNLVGNAVKFTDRGEVRLEASVLPIAPKDGYRVLFTVADTGIGIADAKLEVLFSPFSQGETSYTRRFQGAGLGLSIVKRLVALMGGTVSVESSEGEGTTFYTMLPLRRVARVPPARQDVGSAAPGLKGRGVLLVEDDAASRFGLTKWLHKAGCRVHAVDDGRAVLAALRDHDVDVVLMDIQLPGMGGVEATRRIRHGEAGADKASVPVIALTAYAMEGDRQRFVSQGMNGYVAKPVDFKVLRRVMEAVLAGRSA